MQFRSVLFAALMGLLCHGCASVDQYGSRIYDANINSQDALNQETLLNIVRASRFQTPNFMAISQVSGGQTEAHQLGLPAIFIGPHSGNNPLTNSLSSTVTGGYQANPLITTAFQTGMLSPISPRTIALLINSHQREIVLNLVLEAIEVELPDGRRARLVNDLAQNSPTTSVGCGEVLDLNRGKATTSKADDKIADTRRLYPGIECSFTKFQSLLHGLISSGFTADLTEASSSLASSSQGGSSSASTATTGPSGRFCFRSTLATAKTPFDELRRKFKKFCDDAPASSGPAEKETGTTTTYSDKHTVDKNEYTSTRSSTFTPSPSKDGPLSYPFGEVGNIKLTFIVRSPNAVINYLGRWLQSDGIAYRYLSPQANDILRGEPYVDVRAGSDGSCYASVIYADGFYCVPASSLHTPLLMDIVEDLRNLSIAPTDLNAAFTVRIAN